MGAGGLARGKGQGGGRDGRGGPGGVRSGEGPGTAAELDGRGALEDAGLGRRASARKPFIGNVLRKRPDLARDDRPQLAHFQPVTEGEKFSIGAVVCAEGEVKGHGLGWITGATVAPALGGWLGIGFIKGGHQAWEGKTVVIADPVRGSEIKARGAGAPQDDPTVAGLNRCRLRRHYYRCPG